MENSANPLKVSECAEDGLRFSCRDNCMTESLPPNGCLGKMADIAGGGPILPACDHFVRFTQRRILVATVHATAGNLRSFHMSTSAPTKRVIMASVC
jgi:hypothetical protein